MKKDDDTSRSLARTSLGPGPMGQKFSGNCDVASRHALLHDGATNATRSRRSDSEEAPPCHARGPGSRLARSLATANFRELSLCELLRTPLLTNLNFGELPFRDCMKSGRGVVIHYSST